MTVEEMRAIMRRRVVPENLVVQNIVEYLMDDSAQLPQLNAFSFLSRLQQLGMASADFVVLLEGCGAPQPLVDKIKANPAMNLNNLVLTFESSGLTSDDYSRMLYTARLVWEQTQTSGGTVVPYTADSQSEEYPREKTASELFDDEPESDYTDNLPNNYGEDSSDDEPTFEEIMKHIQSVNFADADKKKPAENAFDEAELNESAVEEADPEEDDEADTDEVRAGGYTENEIRAEDNSAENISDGNDLDEAPSKEFPEEGAPKDEHEKASEDKSEIDGQKQDDKQPTEDISFENVQPQSFDDTSTLIVSIDPEQLKKGIEQSSEELEKTDEKISESISENTKEKTDVEEDENDGTSELGILHEKSVAGFPGSYRSDDGDHSDEDEDSDGYSEEDEDYSDEDDDDYGEDEEYENAEKLRASGYNKPALITSAAGALVLFLICAYFTFVLKIDNTVSNIVYAKNAGEIFSEVYDSYTAGNIGGENAQKYFKGEKLFGTILISEEDFGMLSDGSLVYAASADKITAYDSFDVNTGEQSDILPPENTRFVEIWESESSITAVFSGTECGFMRIEKGEITFTVRQDGELCDFAVSEDENEISFGSVYVPRYTQNFGAADVNEYLPRLGKNEKTVISPENIALGNSSGCSYAIWGKYSLSDGGVVLARAAIGDPVYAGAFGVCAMNYTDKNGETYGRIISLLPEIEDEKETSRKLRFTKTLTIYAAADSKNAFAALAGERVIIFNAELSEEGELEGLTEFPEEMRFCGNMLLLNGEDGIFRVLDCTDINVPYDLETSKASGVVSKDSAAIFEINGLLKATLMKLENGEAKQIGVYSRPLSQSEMDSLELGGAKTTALSGESCAFSYKYFDGVSVVSVCAVFGGENSERSLFDDKTGFNAVFAHNGKIIAVSSRGAEIVFE